MTINYQLIDTKSKLEAFVDEIAQAKSISVDMEADSMHHFKEQICLIQMAANGSHALIDPLAVEDLSVLKPLFADPGIEKIFHGADYDIRSFYRDFKIEVNHLFDTQIAAVCAGDKETGLEALLRSRLGISITKKYQKKDWSMRPLPEGMLQYAIMDVSCLFDLASALKQDLEVMGRRPWVEEECENLTQVRYDENSLNPLFLKVKGAGRLKPKYLAALEAILAFRKSIAEKKNRPLFKIINDRSLMGIVQSMPGDISELERLGILSGKQLSMYGAGLLKSLGRIKQMDPSEYPVYPKRKASNRYSLQVARRVDILKAWRDKKARELDLPEGWVCNKKNLTAIADLNPVKPEDFQKIPELTQWRGREFGQEMISALNKNRS